MNMNKSLTKALAASAAFATVYAMSALSAQSAEVETGKQSIDASVEEAYVGISKQLTASLDKHPQCMNMLVRDLIAEMKKKNIEYDAQTKVVLFDEAKQLIEEKPECALYLGPKAKSMIRNGCLEDIAQKTKDLSKTVYDYTSEKGKQVHDYFKNKEAKEASGEKK